jgi:hypothetical protein
MPCLKNVALNQSLGDCVIAAKTHIDGVLTGNASTLVNATDAQVLSQYEAIGGYNPADPSTDQGCNLQDAMNWWVQNAGPTGHRLEAWLAVDATNDAEVRAALNLFGNVYYGAALPDGWVQNMPQADNFLWDVAGDPDSSNGHCIMQYGDDTDGSALIDTWGLLGRLSPKARAKYMVAAAGGEAYTLLSPDWLITATQKAPNGVAWADIINDWNNLFGGHAPAPSPSPIIPPSPIGVTLAQAEGWFAQAPFFMTPGMAKAILAKNWPQS